MTLSWEQQRRTFERTAEAYDRYRPRYPDALFDGIREYARLGPADRILEIGCGPGIATRALASWGGPVLCVEPAAEMIAVAERNTGGLPNVAFLNATFEDWEIEPGAFGLVVCAQAFHWLDPSTRGRRVAESLRPGGAAAIFGNRPRTDDSPGSFHTRVQDVYRRHAPGLVHGTLNVTDPYVDHVLAGAEGYADLEMRLYPWEWTLTTERYVGLLATHSPHAALPDDARARLLDGIAELVDAGFGGRVTERYFAVLHLARRGAS